MMRASLRSALSVVVVTLLIGAVAAYLLPGYWIYLATAVLITAVYLMSLGLVEGRTGMISLCQLSFAGVGAWTVGYLNVAGAPGGLPVWILIGGLVATPFGVAIGLPALRLRGINLAIVTLGFAGAFDSVLAATTFPGQTQFLQVPRPDLFDSDTAYFVFVLIVFAVLAGGLQIIAGSPLGSSWLAIRHSERAAAAHGVGIPSAKLRAFALSAFVAGIGGGLLAGYLGTLVSDNFTMFGSLSLFAVATMAGAENAEGAVVGGALVTLFPELLRRLDLPQDLGNVLFAVGATQALASGETMSDSLRKLAGRLISSSRPRSSSAQARGPAAAPRSRRSLRAQRSRPRRALWGRRRAGEYRFRRARADRCWADWSERRRQINLHRCGHRLSDKLRGQRAAVRRGAGGQARASPRPARRAPHLADQPHRAEPDRRRLSDARRRGVDQVRTRGRARLDRLPGP